MTHLDAGRSRKDRRVRIGQLQQLTAAITEDKNAGRPIILVGDFNTVSGADEIDSLALELFQCSLGLTEVQPGQSPDRSEHCDGWKYCESRTAIDHLFYRSGEHLEIEVVDAHWRKLRGGLMCSLLSDHPLLVATVRAQRRTPPLFGRLDLAGPTPCQTSSAEAH